MVDIQTLCCMCGDVGFSDKLFHCNKCHNRYQHSYCSNYYSEVGGSISICDWCQVEMRQNSSKHSGSSKKALVGDFERGINNRSEYSDEKIKHQDRTEKITNKGKSGTPSPRKSGTPSPRTAPRRYKLLKDVMC